MEDEMLLQIVNAVDAILNPNTLPGDRATAHSICEACKENEMACSIGFALASKSDAAPHIKHFGLQLMQQFVHNRWTKTGQEIQIQIKNNAMLLMESCLQHESSYVKDGIAHTLAEIIKHVWPQQWPSMIEDLIDLAKLGPIQTELVELVFLRIAEDVAVLHTVSASHRSQDIRHGLSLCMGKIMRFFYDVLESNSAIYIQLYTKANATELQELDMYRTLSISTLKTLQGYLEWVNMEHVFANEGLLIRLLCKLLNVGGLQVLAVECLALAVFRKGQASDRKYVLTLSTPVYIETIVASITDAAAHSQENEQYLFLKRMGNFLSLLSGQIVSSWSDEVSDSTITNLASHTAYLDLLMDFLCQDNPVLSYEVSGSWYQLLQNSSIARDETFVKYVPQLFEVAAKGIRKDVAPSLSLPAQLDFNDDEEIEAFVFSHRVTLLQIIRGCTRVMPIHCANVILEALTAELSLPIETGMGSDGAKLEQCTSKSPTYLRWDAIRNILEIVLKTAITFSKKQDTIQSMPVAKMESLLMDLINCEITDICLCQCLISLIGCFLPVIEIFDDKKKFLISIVFKYAAMVKMSMSHPERWGPVVSQFRRHGLSATIHICKYHPDHVITIYEQFQQAMSEIIAIPNGLTHLEKICVYESMVLVSGEWNMFEQQSALIQEGMSLANDMWLAKDDIRMTAPIEFAAAIGLSSPSSQYRDEQFSNFRNNISFCVSLTLAMINRSRIPEDAKALSNGGFLNENGVVLHPCASHVIGVMGNIASLVQMFHGLWTAGIKSIVHSDYSKSLLIRETERKTMVSFNPITKDPNENREKEPWEKMQTFILIVLENCYQILGAVGKCCNVLFYGSADLFPEILAKSFSDFQTLPELRIRSFTRQFLYYFMKSCPESHLNQVVAPILHKYCNFMNSMLQCQWTEYGTKEQERLKVIESMSDKCQEYEDTKEEDEILKEQLLRIVSREYLELLVNLCINKKPNSKSNTKEEENDANIDTEMQEDNNITQNTTNLSQLTSIGISLMHTEIAELLLTTGLMSISWHDTATAYKGVHLLWGLLKHTFTETKEVPDDAAKFIFESVLLGLQRQGQHDGCQAQLLALSLYVYVALRPTHNSLLTILQGIPVLDKKALATFDQGYTKYAEKKRKVTFKKLMIKIVDQHIGQRFKSKQEMRVLPRFFVGKKAKSLNIDEIESLGLEFFFKPDGR
ncbi:exportin-5-like [Styela clava]